MKYLETFKISFLNTITYIWDAFSLTFFLLLLVYVYINLWTAIFGTQVTIEGFTLPMLIWYVMLTESIFTSTRDITNQINRDIQSGQIAYMMNKPYSYMFFKFAESLGSTALHFIIMLSTGSLLAYVMVGPMQFNFLNFPAVLLVSVLAVSINIMANIIIGLMAFWFEDSKGFRFIYAKFVLIFGGVLIPLEIYPNWLADILNYLPFAYIGYHVGKLFVMFDIWYFLEILAVQAIWLSVFILIGWLLYKGGTRKVSINGG